MPSRSLLSVQEKLERRWRYVQEADWRSIGQHLQHFHDFLVFTPETRAALEQLVLRFPDSSTLASQILDVSSNRAAELRSSKADPLESTAAVAWNLMKHLRDERVAVLPQKLAHTLRWSNREANLDFEKKLKGPEGEPARNEARDKFLNAYLVPLKVYLDESLDTNVETLAAIRWFGHWARWFGASRFEWERRLELEAVEERRKADPTRTPQAQYEKRFQLVLFEKLFEYGLQLEISREPNTAAGSPDFTVIQRTSSGPRPIVVEAKILDKETDPKAKLGHLQIRRYMDTLRADTGYLVLFDLTERGHHVEIPDRLDDLPFLPTGDGRQVYVIHAPCVSQVSASKADPIALKPMHFQFELD